MGTASQVTPQEHHRCKCNWQQGRVRTGDRLHQVLCCCQLGQDIPVHSVNEFHKYVPTSLPAPPITRTCRQRPFSRPAPPSAQPVEAPAPWPRSGIAGLPAHCLWPELSSRSSFVYTAPGYLCRCRHSQAVKPLWFGRTLTQYLVTNYFIIIFLFSHYHSICLEQPIMTLP